MVNPLPSPAQWPLALLGPYLERRVADLSPGPAIRVRVCSGSRGKAGRLSAAMLNGRARITRHPDGRPLANGGYGLSHAYADGLMFAVAGRRTLGCDIEAIAPRAPGVWKGLLGPDRFQLAEQIGVERDEDLDIAATRVWAAMESIRKSGLPSAAPMTIASHHDDGWLLLRSGSFIVVGTVLAVRSAERDLAVAIAAEEAT